MLVCLIPIVDGLVRFNSAWSFPESMTQSFTELEEKSNHTYALFLKFNTGNQFVINLLIMSVLAAVGEEIFFRGILLRVLSKWFGNIHVGVITSALIFTLVHFQPYKILPMLTLGIFLGYVYYRTKNRFGFQYVCMPLTMPLLLSAIGPRKPAKHYPFLAQIFNSRNYK